VVVWVRKVIKKNVAVVVVVVVVLVPVLVVVLDVRRKEDVAGGTETKESTNATNIVRLSSSESTWVSSLMTLCYCNVMQLN